MWLFSLCRPSITINTSQICHRSLIMRFRCSYKVLIFLFVFKFAKSDLNSNLHPNKQLLKIQYNPEGTWDFTIWPIWVWLMFFLFLQGGPSIMCFLQVEILKSPGWLNSNRYRNFKLWPRQPSYFKIFICCYGSRLQKATSLTVLPVCTSNCQFVFGSALANLKTNM